jgi:hypothetical protein
MMKIKTRETGKIPLIANSQCGRWENPAHRDDEEHQDARDGKPRTT